VISEEVMQRRENLKRLLNPQSAVFIGGGGLLSVAIETTRSVGFRGDIWVVNPKGGEIAGLRCSTSLSELPGKPDAAFLAVRAERSVETLRELAAMGCGGAVCYAAGFSESGESDLQEELRAAAGDMAVVGPNCYGVINYLDGMALWPDYHGAERVEKGAAFISQSGNLTLILTMARRGVPISHAISAGNQAVLDASDYVDVLVDDPRVSAIGLYIEGLRDTAAFSRAAKRALERGVPLLAFKGGSSEIGAQMTLSHTGSAAGSASAYRELFERLGVVQVGSLTELFETLKLFCISGAFAGRRLGALTCSGADSVMLADLAEPLGVELPPLSEAQLADMRDYMAGFVNLSNPLDFNTQVWGRSEFEVRCFTSVMRGEQYDATALVHDYPNPERSDPAAWDEACNAFIEAHREVGRPAVLISNLGESLPADARARLCASGVTPLFGLPDGMAAVRHAGWYGERRRALLAADASDA
jgi:acyl-CoA synthetase (NDP forming)